MNMTSKIRSTWAPAVLLMACSWSLLTGCDKEQTAPSCSTAHTGSAKAGWTQTLITPGQTGLAYTNAVAHPADMAAATALDVVRVTYDSGSGLYVYTVEYIERANAAAGTDVWTMPIIFTDKDEHDVITQVAETDGHRVTRTHEERPPVKDGI